MFFMAVHEKTVAAALPATILKHSPFTWLASYLYLLLVAASDSGLFGTRNDVVFNARVVVVKFGLH